MELHAILALYHTRYVSEDAWIFFLLHFVEILLSIRILMWNECVEKNMYKKLLLISISYFSFENVYRKGNYFERACDTMMHKLLRKKRHVQAIRSDQLAWWSVLLN